MILQKIEILALIFRIFRQELAKGDEDGKIIGRNNCKWRVCLADKHGLCEAFEHYIESNDSF